MKIAYRSGYWIAALLIASILFSIGPVFAQGDPCLPPDNEIVCENRLAGTPASVWDVSGAGDPAIQGFATEFSVDLGETVFFKVRTDATDYRLDIYRLGYYNGDGARLMGSVEPSVTLPQSQPTCLFDSTTGLVDCGNWGVSASWAVPSNAVSGVYIAKLEREDGTVSQGSHIFFIVRDDEGASDILFQTSDTTWQAYNRYGDIHGDRSLYVGSLGEFVPRAFKVSYNRPFTTRAYSDEDWFFNSDYPMLRWLERNGYDVSYFTGVDSDRFGGEILEHQVFLSVGHDEYWSGTQRANVEAARDAGVHLTFFSGNDVFWKTRWENSIDGSSTPHRTLVSYKDTHEGADGNGTNIDPVAWTGTWRDARPFNPEGPDPENGLIGTIFAVNCCTYAMEVAAEFRSLRFWRNTSIAAMQPNDPPVVFPNGVLGYEWNDAPDDQYSPRGIVRMSATTVNVPQAVVPEFYGSVFAAAPITHNLTLYKAASGALVFSAGTIQWAWGLDSTHDRGAVLTSADMQQATVNLFADMGVQPASLQTDLVAAVGTTDTTLPTSLITTPDTTTAPAPLTITGTASDVGGVVGAVEVSTDGGTTWRTAQGRENWTFTLNGAPGNYTIVSRAVDDSANIGPNSASITVTLEEPTCPCSIWNLTPSVGPLENDTNAVEVGVKFRADEDGYITALRFYKYAENTGTHIGRLWTGAGTLLTSVTFTNETASGWQEQILPTPVQISANTTYVATYHTTVGYYVESEGYFAAQGVDFGPLRALQNGEDGPNGVFLYGAGGVFPTSTFNASNYWVDVVFTTDVGPDTIPPTVLSSVPANGASGIDNAANVVVNFSEAMDTNTINTSTILLSDGISGVTGVLAYDSVNRRATFNPDTDLAFNTTYTLTVLSGVTDLAGNPMDSDFVASFTVESPPPPPPDEGPGGPVLVISDAGDPFGRYFAEILRTEGLNLFTATDISLVDSALLNNYEVVILAQMTLNSGQVTLLSDWVDAGGNLIAMRPDSQLAALLGLTDTPDTLAEGYLLVNTASGPGVGIVGETIQYHGTADLYTVSDATVLATLYSDAATVTPNPAVTLRSVGVNGGQAAAFTFDLARSIVYTRQGNPAWAGQNRDGSATDGTIRSNDLFYGADPTDPQIDWVNLNKVAIPQADEQQRLLANLILSMNQDNKPLPRFWYLPRGERAAVIMSGDDHGSSNGTANHFNTFIGLSPSGCNVDDWECVRSTSYIYSSTPLNSSTAYNFHLEGFEIGIHPLGGGCQVWTPASLPVDYANELAQFAANFPLLPPPSTNRAHCIAWSDWSTHAAVELANNIRLDTNYYYWPASWVQDRPGMFTGSGMPMRFAALDGSMIDVYQATTQLTDESGQTLATHIAALLDNALGAPGYYGVFTANMHTDRDTSGAVTIINAALARDVPVVSARQMLEWLDGRNGSSFSNLAFNSGTLTFTINTASGARGIQALLPTQSSGGTLQTITLDGVGLVAFTTEVMKGVQYARFDAAAGNYTAVYGADTTPPVIIGRSPLPNAVDVSLSASVTVSFNEPMNAGTISTSSFRLRADGALSDVAATVTYDAGTNTATLNPTADLSAGTLYTVTVENTITDANGIALAAVDSWNFTTAAAVSCPCTVFDNSPAAAGNLPIDPSSGSYGLRFRSAEDGYISGIRFYKHANNIGPHVGQLYTNGGVLLAQVNFADVGAAAGWQEALFSTPVAITANTTYVASYFTPTGNYAFTSAGLSSAITNDPLTALADGFDGANGVYQYSPTPVFPTNTFNSTNYWVDVVFINTLPADTTPPVISSVNAVPGIDTAQITWTTDEAATSQVDYGTAPDQLTQNASDPALVTGHTINLSSLLPNTIYYYQVTSVDAATNSASSTVLSFTTQGCPCTIWDDSFIPAVPAVTDNRPIEVGVKFRAEVDGFITGLRFYKGTLNTGTHTGHLWAADGTMLAEAVFINETAEGWQQVILSTPVAITANTTYVASYFSPSGYFAINAGGLNAGFNNPPLRALAHNEDGPNGVFLYDVSGFPTGGGGANYWVDVVFVTEPPADTTPPIISSVNAVPGIDTAQITWTTDEAATSRVDYGTAPDQLTQNISDPALVTGHTINLSSLLPNTTYYYQVTSVDAAANSASSTVLSFITLPLSVNDTTTADFTQGTPDGCAIWELGNGSVLLAPSAGSDFAGSSLPAGWSSFIWNAGGSVSIGSGLLTVDGARFNTDAFFATNRAVEFVATFGAATFQNIGFGEDLSTTSQSWAVFGTANTTNRLFARTNDAGSSVDVEITTVPNLFGTPHLYRIVWESSEVRYYIDDTLVHTQPAVIEAQMRPVISDFGAAGPNVTVDWLRMSPYPLNCTFTSRVFDAGTPVNWGAINWTALVPAGTSFSMSVRTGNTPDPLSGGWTSFAPIANGDSVGAAARYIQYQAVFGTDSAFNQTPVLENVSLLYSLIPPTPPLAEDDSYNTDEDTALNIAAPGVLDNDSDINGDALTANLVEGPSSGLLTLNLDGSFLYTPNANFNGVDSFTYRANDGSADSNTATVTITVNPVNDAPVAVNDSAPTDEDTPVNITVLTNDGDPDGAVTLTVTLDSSPSNGLAVVNGDGTITYTPNANFNGGDSFTYTASDGIVSSNVATVTITVNPVNDAPVAVNDSAATDEDTPVNITILTNDGDPDGVVTLTAALDTNPSNGVVVVNGDGTITYTPNANFNGGDSFTYTASDGIASSNVATVTVTVNPVNDAPVAAADNYLVNENASLNVAAPGVLANDNDVDGDLLQVSLITGPSNGLLTLNLDGSFIYTPTLGYFGPDSFSYLANDGLLNSNPTTVSITVILVNEAPVAEDDSYSTDEDASLNVAAPGVLGNDNDADNDPLTATVADEPDNGSLSLNANGGFSYTPNANFNGTDSFTYTVSDGIETSNAATVTITVNPVNDAPVALDDSAPTDEDTPVNIAVLANDSDVDADPLTPSIAAAPAVGSAVVNLDGTITYTPALNYSGVVTFTYTVSDGLLSSNEASVTVTVNPVNDAPITGDDSAFTDEDTPVTITVLANDSDPDGAVILTVTLDSSPSNGLAVVNGDGSITYTPNANFNGFDSFSYTLSDGIASSNVATVTVTVNPVNDAPVAAVDNYIADQGSPLNISAPGVLANDSDVENSPLSAQLVSGVSNGNLTLNPDGSFSYTSSVSFSGVDSFTYQAFDGELLSNIVTVNITVNDVNFPPTADSDVYSTNEDTPLNVSAPGVLDGDNDLDGDLLTAELVSSVSNGLLTLNPDGSFLYTPNTNFNGSDSFTYKAAGGGLESAPATVTINVNPVNDAPSAVNDSFGGTEDTPLTVNVPGVLGNDSDLESGFTASLVTGPAFGSLTLNPDGSFSYTPDLNFNGADSFTYRAFDGGLFSNEATVTLNIAAVNDAPTADSDSYDVEEDTTLVIDAANGVLNGDNDVDSAPLTAVLSSLPANGSLTLNPDGSFSYTPNLDFVGIDSFTYTAFDGALASNLATVTINVGAVNDAPVAGDDGFSMDEDTILSNSVLGNDFDVDGNPLTVILVTSPSAGSLTLNPDGSFGYTPPANFNGVDSFSYKLNDGLADSNVATVTITVNPVNDVPTAGGDAYATNEDQALLVGAPGVLDSDTDIDGDALTTQLVTGISNGTLTLNADGSFLYTPNAHFNGSDTFIYRAVDPSLEFAEAMVTITVNPVNDTPTAAADAYSTTEDAPLLVGAPGVLANDSDVENQPLSAVLVSGVSNGSLTLNPDGSFLYTPNAHFNGSDSFSYKANDGQADSNTVLVSLTINPAADEPVLALIGDQSVSENDTLTLNLSAVDADNDSLSFSTSALPAFASFVDHGDGTATLSFVPGFGDSGSYSITVNVSDGALSDSETFNLEVVNVNRAPVLASIGNQNVAENALLEVNLSASDPDNDSLSFSTSALPSFAGFVDHGNGTATLTLQPNFDDAGSYSLSVTVSDGDLNDGETFNIEVTNVNRAPQGQNDDDMTDENVPLTVPAPGVLNNDSDPDNDALTALLDLSTTNGGLTLNPDGSFSYTPNAGFNGQDSFTYRASDGTDSSAPVTVTITVNPVNDAPAADDDGYTTDEDTPLNVAAPGVLDGDTDPDGPALTAILANAPANGVVILAPDGSFSYTPNANFNGQDSFTYQASDSIESSNLATVTITVNPVNDAPGLAAIGDASMNEGETLIVNLASSDVDNASLTLGVNGLPSFASFVDNGNGTGQITFTPGIEDQGIYNLTVTVSDGSLDDSETFSLTVNDTQSGGLTARYFNNRTLTGTPALTRIDPTVDFNWGVGSPDPIISTGSFSARWTGKIVPPTTGSYTFYTQSDDGVRLWVNGQLLIQNWTNHPATEDAGPAIVLQGGQQYDILIEYYEYGGVAVMHLLWSGPGIDKSVVPQANLIPEDVTPPPPSSGGLTGKYFNNRTLTGTPALTRIDPTVDFNWGSGSDHLDQQLLRPLDRQGRAAHHRQLHLLHRVRRRSAAVGQWSTADPELDRSSRDRGCRPRDCAARRAAV